MTEESGSGERGTSLRELFWLMLLSAGIKTKIALALAFYFSFTLFFPWQLTAIVMAMVFVHEKGHVWACKLKKLKTNGFCFIPLLGGITTVCDDPTTADEAFYITVAGPLVGGVLAIPVVGFYVFTSDEFWAAAALIILCFNLFPIMGSSDGLTMFRCLAASRRVKFDQCALLEVFGKDYRHVRPMTKDQYMYSLTVLVVLITSLLVGIYILGNVPGIFQSLAWLLLSKIVPLVLSFSDKIL